jgi:DNA-binding PadR family transcriptional regulator
MIVLQKNQDIEVYQVELAIKKKAKQSPFISVLILAQETGELCAEDLCRKLLVSLPVKAGYNLLKRLEQQGYLDSDDSPEITTEQIEDIYKMQKRSLERTEKYLDNLINASRNINACFQLTELGEKCATDKSYWIGEKGIYNVYVCHSKFIQQKITKIEKVEKAEDDRVNRIMTKPKEILQVENQILTFNTNEGLIEVLIEGVEQKCFSLKPANCILKIQSKDSEAIVEILKDNQLMFMANLDLVESDLQEQLLSSASSEFGYDAEHKAILTSFSNEDTSLKRKVKIMNPLFKRISFDPVELQNITHIPKDKYNADLWYLELLYKNTDRYFIDDNSFDEFASEIAKLMQPFYKVDIPKRKELADIFSKREDAFYQTAKLETIDYLSY